MKCILITGAARFMGCHFSRSILDHWDVLDTFADISHTKDKLGFESKVGIEKGIEKFVEWYKSYFLSHHNLRL